MKESPIRNSVTKLMALVVCAVLGSPSALHSESCCGTPSPRAGCPQVIEPSFGGPSNNGDIYTCSSVWSGSITRTYSDGTQVVTLIGSPPPPPPVDPPPVPAEGAYLINIFGEASGTPVPPFQDCPMSFFVTPAQAPCKPRRPSYHATSFSEDTIVIPCADDGGDGGEGSGGNEPGEATASTGSIHLGFNLGLPAMPLPPPNSPPQPRTVPRSHVFALVNKEHIAGDAFSTGSIVIPVHYGVTVVDYGVATGGHRRRQVLTSSGLTDFVPAKPEEAFTGYWVRFYTEATWNDGPGSEDYYQGTGDPAREWKVADVSAGSVDSVQLTKTGHPNATKTLSEYADGKFEFFQGNSERVVTVTEIPQLDGTTITTRSVKKAGESAPYEQEVTIKKAGLAIERQYGIAPALVVTKYDHDADGTLLLMRRFVNGGLTYWERYIRQTIGGVVQGVKTVRPYKNSQPANMTFTGAITDAQHPANSSHDVAYLAQGHVLDTSVPLQYSESIPKDDGSGVVSLRSETTTIRENTIEIEHPTAWDVDLSWKLEVATTTGGSAVPIIRKVFHRDTPEPFTSLPFFEQDEDGTTRRYSYSRGDWNATATTFTPSSAGNALQTAIIHGVPRDVTAGPMTNVTKKEVRIEDAEGRTVQEEEFICTSDDENPTVEALTRTVHFYNSEGRRTSSVLHSGGTSRTIYNADWVADRKESETDEMGVETDFENFDALGRARRVIRRGIDPGAGLPGIADREINRTFDPLHRVRTETTTASGSTITKTWDFDAAGRPTGQTVNGMLVSTSYPSGLQTTRTRSILQPSVETIVIETQLHSLDGEIEGISGATVLPQTITRGATSEFRWRRISRGGENAPFLTETRTDSYGRTVAEISRVGTADVQKDYQYDGLGNLWSETPAGFTPGGSDDFAPRFHYRYFGEYNGFTGLVQFTTQESGEAADGTRIEWSVEYHAKEDNAWYRVVQSHEGTEKEKVSGFEAGEISKTIRIDSLGNITTTRSMLNRTAKTVTQTVSRTGLNDAVTIIRNGFVQSVTTPSVSNPRIFSYDGHGRRTAVKDARTGSSTSTTYDPDFGQPATVTGEGISVTNVYYPKTDRRAGRLKMRTTNIRTTFFDYDHLGRQVRVWGHTYPLRYEYDLNGRLSKLHTYKADPNWTTETLVENWGTGDMTTWTYYPGTTQLQQKRYADNKGPGYTYWPSGLLKQRTWARESGGVPLTTDYTYNDAGELKKIDYSDGTPDVDFLTADADGRPLTVQTKHWIGGAEQLETRTLSYDALGQVESEAIVGGPLNGIALNPGYTATDWKGKLEAWNLTGIGGQTLAHSFGYEPGTGRLLSVSDGAATATYGYYTNSDALQTTTLTHNGAAFLTTTRMLDTANRLQKIEAKRGATVIESHQWSYDIFGNRQNDYTHEGRWSYGYNARGEVTSGQKYLASGPQTPGYSFGYGYDAIGNRLSTTTNGRVASYGAANHLNQYPQRAVPGAVDVRGTIEGEGAQVRVSGGSASAPVWADRAGNGFNAAMPVDNAGAAQKATFTVRGIKPDANGADYQKFEQREAFVLKTPEVFHYDDDGNLKEDGRWTYEWDGENRLVAMELREAVYTATQEPQLRLEFSYDYRGRRIEKRVFSWNPSTNSYQPSTSVRFAYDTGWNLLAESTPNGWRTYLWGSDLSGSLQGAGGVGGLLVQTDPAQAKYAVAYDGNGNVKALVGTNGTIAAAYEYGPFGEPLRATGPMVQANPFRFSTKYHDNETGLLYYGYRYNQPTTGRWLNRDPIDESGGANLHSFVLNNALAHIDLLGEFPSTPDYIKGYPNQAGYSNAGGYVETKPGWWTMKVTVEKCGPRECQRKFKVTEKQGAFDYWAPLEHIQTKEQEHIDDVVRYFDEWIGDIDSLGSCQCKDISDCFLKIAKDIQLKVLYYNYHVRDSALTDLGKYPGRNHNHHGNSDQLKTSQADLTAAEKNIKRLEIWKKTELSKCSRIKCTHP